MFDDPDVAAELAEIHEKFVVVPTDKASNNIVFVCIVISMGFFPF